MLHSPAVKKFIFSLLIQPAWVSCLRWAAQIDKSLGEKGPEQNMLLNETWRKKTFHHNLYGIVQQLRICTNLTLRRHIKAESTKASGRVWKHRHFPRIAWTFFPSHIFVRIDVWALCDNNWCCLPPKWTIFLWIQHKARCWSQRARLPAQQGIRKIMYLVSNQFMWLSNIEDYESVLKLEFKWISSSSYPWFYCLSKSCTQYFENLAVAAILDKGLRNFKHCCILPIQFAIQENMVRGEKRREAGHLVRNRLQGS